jgi:hypothetical protein
LPELKAKYLQLGANPDFIDEEGKSLMSIVIDSDDSSDEDPDYVHEYSYVEPEEDPDYEYKQKAVLEMLIRYSFNLTLL